METIVWLAIFAGIVVVLWFAAPHHHGMIDERDIPAPDKTPWD
jgi:hypothetical protein